MNKIKIFSILLLIVLVGSTAIILLIDEPEVETSFVEIENLYGIKDLSKMLGDENLREELRTTNTLETNNKISKYYYSDDKRLLLEEGEETILDIELYSPYKVEGLVASPDTKVAEFYLTEYNREYLFDSLRMYDVKKGYEEFERDVWFKYGIDKEVCGEFGCKIETDWIRFDSLSELPSKNIKIGMFTSTFANEYVEWIPTINGFEILEWATFNISGASYLRNLTSAVGDQPNGVKWGKDGEKLYIAENAGDRIQEYNCSDSYNVSSCINSSALSITIQEGQPRDLEFNGTKLFVIGSDADEINEYNCSSAWHINSCTFSTLMKTTAYETSPLGMWFNDSGTGMYVVGNGNGRVVQYLLSKPFLVNSSTYVNVLDISGEEAVAGGIAFNPEGTLMQIVGYDGNDITQYSLSTAWDITSATPTITLATVNEGSPTGMDWDDDGTNFIVCGMDRNWIAEYNTTSEVPLATPTIEVNLTFPLNNSHISTSTIKFNASYTLSNMNITNGTYYIYNNTGIFNKTTVDLTPANNKSNLTISNFTVGNYKWNVYGCGINNSLDITCNWSSIGNFTFEFIPFTIDSTAYKTNVVETNSSTFQINISSASGYTVGTAHLIYNGTTYANTNKVSIDSDSFSLTKTINIPPMSLNPSFNQTNVTFFWNISLTNENTGGTSYSTTSNYNQTVSELKFEVCSTNVNVSVLNFTLFDELTGNIVDASTNATFIQSYFDFGVNSGYKAKNYSFQNLSSLNHTFWFCTDNTSRKIYVNMDGIFSAVDYEERNYYLDNSILTNASNEIPVYLLTESEATEFFITITQNLRYVEDATVQVSKFFIGDGVYKTVEIDQTDSNGEFNAYLDLDRDYQAVITKNGVLLGVKTFKASCSSAPCEITLDIQGGVYDLFDLIDSQYAENVYYNLSFNGSTRIVKFQFVDITGLAHYFRMAVYNSNSSEDGTLISNQTLYSSSGAMTFNVSAYSGQFIAKTFVSRSPEIPLNFITFMISELYDELGDYAGEALLLMFLLILTFIFGLAFKPSILMLSIPFIMHLGVLSGIFPIGMSIVVVFYIFALLGVIAISKGK